MDRLMYWRHKTASDNQWHPIPGAGTKLPEGLPSWLYRLDGEAIVVDAAPFVVGAGAFRHLSQAGSFGFTASASIFKNPRTILAMHNTASVMAGLILTLQLSGIQYRQMIPRWASDREQRRDEEEARQHIDTGILMGAGILLARTVLKKGPTPSLLDVILGGALGDLMLREYFRAHNL